MNLGLITSYIIAGFIFIGISMVNISLQSSSSELAITQITRSHVSNITEILNDDISNMGYDVDQTTMETKGVILDCKLPHRISFYSNIYGDPDSTARKIEWRFLKDEVLPDAKNEQHRALVRTVYDSDSGAVLDKTEIKVGITKFQIRYFDTVGKPVDESLPSGGGCSDITDVKQIHIELEVQSPEKVYNRAVGEGRYIRSVWDKRFTPINLNL